jgi:hypothetical protein
LSISSGIQPDRFRVISKAGFENTINVGSWSIEVATELVVSMCANTLGVRSV